ncbi:DNA damage-inducible protein D [Dyadobacter sp. CY261]|uniref:DNA damage-inducible protein D n=1 Tax=Dyadobacter sp. CY261 TaxID=2907203 RepID=UPI001F1B2B78|nr:DNA damage-inducible protein D [Dyadobacter sp. CY261]MCF0071129.1 DNA damage-inducible protein D [Dyadobacter sp. CY261]
MTTPQGPSLFEQIRKSDDNGNEFWSARDLAKVLEYTEYRHFKPAMERAREACTNSGQNVVDHFEHMLGMIGLGKGGKRMVENVKLSRYACYLIVQNADPAKEVVALGQTYFAVQTRLQEIRQMEEYNRLDTEDEKRIFLRGELTRNNLLLAEAAKTAGIIEPIDYAIFQNHGYMGLYGGLDAKAIKERKELKKNQSLLDHMGSSELAANVFRATQTDDKLRRENIVGKEKANRTHFEVGAKVRQTIQELGGTMPEDLPLAESIKKVGERPKRKRFK